MPTIGMKITEPIESPMPIQLMSGCSPPDQTLDGLERDVGREEEELDRHEFLRVAQALATTANARTRPPAGHATPGTDEFAQPRR
jgi:hypothetical protein